MHWMCFPIVRCSPAIENVGGHEIFTLDGEALTWQANGSSIIYQGTSDQRPNILPKVTFMLDGKEATAEDIKNAQGTVTMDVSFLMAEKYAASRAERHAHR